MFYLRKKVHFNAYFEKINLSLERAWENITYPYIHTQTIQNTVELQ